MPRILVPLFAALLCGTAPVLSAPTQPRAVLPDPLSARAPVPPAVHASAVAKPRPVDDPPPVDWRAANARVGQLGGWRHYARETLPKEASR